MSAFDYYQELGVSRDATTEEIRAAYRKLAAKLHPDVNQDHGAEERFKRVTEAHDVLRDPLKRRKYDHFGPDWNQVDDAFAEQYERDLRARKARGMAGNSGRAGHAFRGFGTPGGQSAPEGGFEEWIAGIFRDGDSGVFDMDAAFGGSKFGRSSRRPGRPEGATRRPRHPGDREATLRLSLEEAAEGGRREFRIGEGPDGQSRTVAVTLPPGLRGGEVMRLSGLGGPSGPGGPGTQTTGGDTRGDLYLRIELLPHPAMRLVGDDVHWVVPVAPWEAALGAELDVRAFGRTLRLRVPEGSQNGSRLRLRGAGYPQKYGGGRGDLLVELRIHGPTHLTDEERKAYETLRRVSKFRPRG